ncbi:type I phosphomannose isomerase catalytic subunit [Chloroflexus sp.]|uniref:type I phosphomannose isomerase catalytic subunit n=1 Tax=Chloroflexus sp. TaxID=1904827 RepID=UPI0026387F69|nr:type I phosphomannose isomerase catalytic subunit [uncultured Chloroflexus sp.]
MNALYPILCEPRLIEPLWGGQQLASWLDLPPPHPERIGEIWLVFDSNRVSNGPLAGTTIGELARDYGAALVGTRPYARYGGDLPLLAKFIDAADRLSVQVHPDDDYAHTYEAHTGFHGKTEAWYILAAEPGATVTLGTRATIERDRLATAIADGTVEELLAQQPVRAGDLIFVPAGTIHAINAGIMLFEIQQKSDLTYRIYDYNRRDARTGQPRTLHIDQALAVSRLEPATTAQVPPLTLDEQRQLLIACSSFALERWQVKGRVAATTDPGSLEILTVIAGAAQLAWQDETLELRRGAAVLLPATLGAYEVIATEATMLRSYVPDLASLIATIGAGDGAATIFP